MSSQLRGMVCAWGRSGSPGSGLKEGAPCEIHELSLEVLPSQGGTASAMHQLRACCFCFVPSALSPRQTLFWTKRVRSCLLAEAVLGCDVWEAYCTGALSKQRTLVGSTALLLSQ